MAEPTPPALSLLDSRLEHIFPTLTAAQIARNLIGEPDIDIEIHGVSLWGVNEMWATHLQSGRVFCVGDAIHRHPPGNALGANTSVQDSHNLVWKIAAVLRGQAAPSLLETYIQDLLARAMATSPTRIDTQQSLRNLGVDSLIAVEVRNRINADLGMNIPLAKMMQSEGINSLAAHVAERLLEGNRSERLKAPEGTRASPDIGAPLTGANAADHLRLRIRTHWAARIAQFWRSAFV